VLEVALVIGGGLLVLSQLLTRDLAAALTIITLFLVAGSRIIPSILRLQGALLVIRSSAGQAAPTYRLANDLRHEVTRVEVQIVDTTRTPPTFVADVDLSDVHFSYPESKTPAIADVSLHVPQGSSLAITGPTGSGKSTLADLILGVLDPDSGSISIGSLRSSEAVKVWPGRIGYVPQHVAISNTTLRSNVALGLPLELVDDDLVWHALAQARLVDLVNELPAGLDCLVGENGVRLSGGQRQRLGLARALYTEPALLLLDEATSALDAETEHAISAALNEVHGQVTTILIAHRLATVTQSDQVIYLVDGSIVARGRFDDVRQQSPAFDKQAQLMGL
jgi:ABC-type multidrug transport system fused ATPase/permease subunit